jgi:hypothetical protein
MTKTKIREKLEKNGYKITTCMSGVIIATKNNMSYSDYTLTALYRRIF